jgi:subfamily B ATP-binding cassette protein HlyB/CyaB
MFETILGILRTYLFAHTTNRIDVELGARLFHHLLALPMAYFQARRVGDSVARVRELENVRNFLTSSALTLVIDLFFALVFLAVMFFYSPLLTAIVCGSLPFYVAISAAATPLFRQRLDEKFRLGAENQAFLVESVTGIETLKAMAVEPQMQRRWEEQLAGYVAASFRVLSLGNTASQVVQFINKIVTAGILYFGAKLVIDGGLSVGELVAFNILAGRVSAPVLRLAQIRTFTKRACRSRGWATSSTPRPSRRIPSHAPGCRRSAATSGSTTSRSAIASTDPRSCTTSPSMFRPDRRSASLDPRGRGRARSQSSSSVSTFRRAGAS